MENAPFTLDQATEIAEDFEDLVDTGFIKEGRKWIISSIEVCPFHEAHKSLYPQSIITKSKAATALNADDASQGFDVTLLLTDGKETATYSSIDIRSFADLMGINYRFPA